jgi:hypothetical protein
MDKDRTEESQKALMLARYEAICDVLDGIDPGDFMMSFPDVRKVYDLKYFYDHQDEKVVVHPITGSKFTI